MTTIVQLLVSGIAMGFIYGLVAVGVTLIWNSTSMLNFANDKVILMSSYLFGVVFMAVMGTALSSAATVIAVAVFGVVIATVVFIPLRNMNRLTTIMATIMLGKVVSEVLRLTFGAISFTVKNFVTGQVRFGEIVIARAYVYVIVIGTLVACLLQLFLSFTKAGKAMRCVSINKTAAALMGVNVKKYMRLTGAISFAIGSVVGILIIPLFDISLNMTSMIGLKGFASAVVGGFGSLPGAIAGGILIGIVENYGGFLLSAGYKDAIAFILLIIFLLINPTGLSGMFRRDRSKIKPRKISNGGCENEKSAGAAER